MDPRTYCEQGMVALRSKPARRRDLKRPQRIVVLSYFAQRDPSDRDFARQLAQLAESSDRLGRRGLAEAARAVLRDWEARRRQAEERPAGAGPQEVPGEAAE